MQLRTVYNIVLECILNACLDGGLLVFYVFSFVSGVHPSSVLTKPATQWPSAEHELISYPVVHDGWAAGEIFYRRTLADSVIFMSDFPILDWKWVKFPYPRLTPPHTLPLPRNLVGSVFESFSYFVRNLL